MRTRHELKYTVLLEDSVRLIKAIADRCENDAHADSKGCYEVASLYYDTPNLRFFWDREESVGYRRKVRLRAYVVEDAPSALFLEIKEKHKHLVAKKRVELRSNLGLDLTRNFALCLEAVLRGSTLSDEATQELQYLHEHLHLVPTVTIRYIRQTLLSRFDNDLRITIDKRITAGQMPLINANWKAEHYILPENQCVLEVKCSDRIPAWLATEMGRLQLMRTRFSKYCEAVKHLKLQPQAFSFASEVETSPSLPKKAVGQ